MQIEYIKVYYTYNLVHFCRNKEQNMGLWLGLFRHENFLMRHRFHILKIYTNKYLVVKNSSGFEW